MLTSFYLFNSLTRGKQRFVPRTPEHIKIYVCGPTVYNRIHLGNARPNIVFDVLYRLLKNTYKNVTYVRNITDVDDKIIQRAHEESISIKELTHKTIDFFQQDMTQLNVLPPTKEPLATEHIPHMIAFIQRLMDKNYAYLAEKHVLFDVEKDANYGHLSNRTTNQMRLGARIDIAPYKRNPIDFVLWKPTQLNEPGWESPWGRGRPGWHIECSAMSHAHLGSVFDIHGGGQDLLFPHHENECAQSTCAYGKNTFAKYWMHCGMITIKGQKMSKSLGNFVSIEDALSQASGSVVRYAILATHYRHPLDWTNATLEHAQKSLDRLYSTLKDHPQILEHSWENNTWPSSTKVIQALCDDLNTPLALCHLHEITKQIHKEKKEKNRQKLVQTLVASAHMLGLMHHTPQCWHQGDHGTITPERIVAHIAVRTKARAEKNFDEADRIRVILATQNVLLEDVGSKTLWRWKSDKNV